jgi:hypothetical protein
VGVNHRMTPHFRKNAPMSVPGRVEVRVSPWRVNPAWRTASSGMPETFRRTLECGVVGWAWALTGAGWTLTGFGRVIASFSASKTEALDDGPLLDGIAEAC